MPFSVQFVLDDHYNQSTYIKCYFATSIPWVMCYTKFNLESFSVFICGVIYNFF